MATSNLIDELKRAIRESGLSLAEIARQSGVDHARLSRFLRDERTLTLPAAGKVFAVLGLRVVRERSVAKEKIAQQEEGTETAGANDKKPKRKRSRK